MGQKPTDDKQLDEKRHGAKFGIETTVRLWVKFVFHTNTTPPINAFVLIFKYNLKYR